jgi:aryl-alcohol dehydrogenase-like predicted oxidoreductase
MSSSIPPRNSDGEGRAAHRLQSTIPDLPGEHVKFRTLPATDLSVSDVCLGTMTWGEQNSEADAHRQLDHAIAQGINFIDTAEMYPVPPNATTQGRTEAFLGSWLRRRGGKRDLIIATKVAGPGRRDWIRQGRTDLTADVIAEAADTSLARLSIDVIDLFQIHWPQRNVPMFGAIEFDPSRERPGPDIREQVEAMAALVRAGKIRYYGLSNETSWGVCAFKQAARELGVPGPVTTQNSYSLVSRGPDGDLAEALFREKMSLLAYSPLAGGLLTGKYAGGAKPPDARYTRFDGIGNRFRRPIVHEAVEAYREVATKRGLSLVELALGWVRSRWHVGATIIGATTMQQLDEDIAAAQRDLDAETLADIAAVQVRYPNPAT